MSCAELLEATNRHGNIDARNVQIVLREVIDVLVSGNQAALAKFIGRNKSAVSEWRSGKTIPRIEALLQLSYCVQVPLAAFAKGDTREVAFGAVRTLPSDVIRKRSTRARRAVHDWEKYAQTINDAIEEKYPRLTTMQDIANLLDVSLKTLTRRFPEATRTLALSFADRRRTKSANRKQVQVEVLIGEIAKARAVLDKEGRHPSRRQIVRIVREGGFYLDEWEYKKLWLAYEARANPNSTD